MVRRALNRAMLFLLLSSGLIISMLTPLEPMDYLFSALSTQLGVAPFGLIMISDILLLIAGYLLSSSLHTFLAVGSSQSVVITHAYSRLGSLNKELNGKGLLSLTAALLLIVIWYVPEILNAALLQFEMHLLMLVSLLFAGVLIFVGFARLSSNMRLFSYLLGCKAMAVFGAYLLVSPALLYNYFPYYEQAEAGAAMVAMCVASDATIIPLWLRRYFKGQ
jgi:hypothetical protein